MIAVDKAVSWKISSNPDITVYGLSNDGTIVIKV